MGKPNPRDNRREIAMNIPNIKFDLDGVLVDFLSHFTEFMEARGYKIGVQDKFHFKITPHPGDKMGRLIMKASSEWNEIDPMPHAQELVERLYVKAFCPIDIITARSPIIASSTQILVRKIFPDIPVRISYASSNGKFFYMDDANIFVEDRRKTAIGMAMLGYTVIMPDRTYNKLEGTSGEKRMVTIDAVINMGSMPPGRIVVIKSLKDLLDPAVFPMLIKKPATSLIRADF